VNIEKKLALGEFTKSVLYGGASEVKAGKSTGAGNASSLARLRTWFFPESDEVIGEIAAAGCRNQPGEKSENKIAGKPMPSRRKGKLLCQRQPNNRQKIALRHFPWDFQAG
jgi:hypothetical protein